MRINPIMQQNQPQIHPQIPIRPTPAGQGQNHSSILQNNSCCSTIFDYFKKALDGIVQFFKRLCCSWIPVEKAPAIPGQEAIEPALRLKDGLLRALLNRARINNEMADQHIHIDDADQFKAAIILTFDDRIIAHHRAQVNMDALENGFSTEASRIMEQTMRERAPDGILRGRQLEATVIIVRENGNGRFDGAVISSEIGLGRDMHGNGASVLPNRERLALGRELQGRFPGGNDAARRELALPVIGFLVNLPENR